MTKISKKTLVNALMLLLLSEVANASEFSLIDPCEEKVLGFIPVGKATRINAVQDALSSKIESAKQHQRFLKYDIEESARTIKLDFGEDAEKLARKLVNIRSEFSEMGTVTLDGNKSLSGHAATEYIYILLVRYAALVGGIEYIENTYHDVDTASINVDKLVARLSVIESLIDTSSSYEILDSACVAFKRVDQLDVEFPFRDTTSLRQYALQQSEPLQESALSEFIEKGTLPFGSLTVNSAIDELITWTKSLFN